MEFWVVFIIIVLAICVVGLLLRLLSLRASLGEIARELNDKLSTDTNTLINAAKYSDGDLKIGLSPDGTVSFENSAKDLDAVQTAHLFDRFFTVNTARGGTGLGLSIAKLLTEKMGGSIAAQYRKGKLSICVLFQNG